MSLYESKMGNPFGWSKRSKHDGPVSEALAQPDYIVVMDRAYGKLERLDDFKIQGQSFVIRLRENVKFGETSCTFPSQEGRFIRHSGYHLPVGDTAVSFRATSSCGDISGILKVEKSESLPI
ncbi:hypothetical protein [Paenibacillus sp. 23TSA30-6]|uniref:hypothetical protein n=1 Tax=Paenibacillus sp. 23TSA30-6 TaxID=2546104 RepID=UPI003FCCEE7A